MIAVLVGQALLMAAAALVAGSEVEFRGEPSDTFNRYVQYVVVSAAVLFPFLMPSVLDLPLAVTASAIAVSWIAVMRLRQALRKEKGTFV